MASLKIHPLHVGTITRPIANFCHGLEPGTVSDLPLICWYIEGSNQKILVDTGGGDPFKANPRWLPYKREHDQTIEDALQKLGLTCDDIDMVVVTHLHWDHCADNMLFQNAEIIVQQEEWRSARSATSDAIHAYIPYVVENVDYSLISGDKEIAEGVQVIFTPGHTYGMQGVLVEGQTRSIFIASDTLPLFKNIEQDHLVMSDIYVDLHKYQESLNKIAALSALILPGHDFKVFEKEVYS